MQVRTLLFSSANLNSFCAPGAILRRVIGREPGNGADSDRFLPNLRARQIVERRAPFNRFYP